PFIAGWSGCPFFRLLLLLQPLPRYSSKSPYLHTTISEAEISAINTNSPCRPSVPTLLTTVTLSPLLNPPTPHPPPWLKSAEPPRTTWATPPAPSPATPACSRTARAIPPHWTPFVRRR